MPGRRCKQSIDTGRKKKGFQFFTLFGNTLGGCFNNLCPVLNSILAHSMFDSIDNRLEAPSDIEPSENIVHMTFYRLFADKKLVGNFFIGIALC